MNGEHVVELVNLFTKYYSETGNDNIQEFSVWLNKNFYTTKTIKDTPAENNRMLIWLTHRLSKLYRWYAKETLHANGLKSMDEYFFLVSIEKLGLPSKTEVYKDTITDINTGTQMMKRLIEAKLIEEITDSTDKRIRRVRLTQLGKKTKANFFAQSNIDLKLKAGNLSIKEKALLIELLSYLEKFHSNIYFNDYELEITDLIKKYIT